MKKCISNKTSYTKKEIKSVGYVKHEIAENQKPTEKAKKHFHHKPYTKMTENS